MCLNLVGRVAEEKDGIAFVEFEKVKAKALNLIGAKKGDIVLVQGKTIIEVLEKEKEKQVILARIGVARKKKKSNSEN